MKFFETSKYFSLKKSTYINLRWIAIIGQFMTINIVFFIFNFEFNYKLTSLIIFIGTLSNLYLIYKNPKTQLLDKTAFIFLLTDVLQLSFLIYLTGGIANPFSIFLIIPTIFSSSNLGFRSNLLLVSITFLMIIFLTFFHQPMPSPVNQHFHVSLFYYYSIPVSLIIALVFLNYFASTFGTESRLRKEALNKMEEVMAKEHELLSLGGQAAAAAHSLGTPFSTMKIISGDLLKQFKGDKEVKKDIELLVSQIDRCSEILKRLTLNPIIEDDFIDRDITINDYIAEIVKSFQKISEKNFFIKSDEDNNPLKIAKSIEIVYGLRNFIGNANKFSKSGVFINLKSNNNFSEIIIEDDGDGYPKDVLGKIGEPYIRSFKSSIKSQSGLGLGIFIGKTLLEKNYANIECKNSKSKNGAYVSIKWSNKDLLKI
ncbi:ActS/PrrB/RegB family redox-sensitive histidine kinase [Candidatus Pelagibacter sp.]|nr:ActS/PrrB/RegB family redox-sensitive histidine kinase [Candidatus Pelagibacter sp.]